MKMTWTTFCTALLLTIGTARAASAGADVGVTEADGAGGHSVTMTRSGQLVNGQMVTVETTVNDGIARTVVTTNEVDSKGSFFVGSAGGGVPFGGMVFAGNAADKSNTWLGVSADPLPETVRAQLPGEVHGGLLVRQVVAGSPAAAAGVRENDVLLRLDDQLLYNGAQLRALVRDRKSGEKVRLTLLRKGREQSVEATLAIRSLPEAEEMVFDVGGWNTGDHDWIRVGTNVGPVIMMPRPAAGEMDPATLPPEILKRVQAEMEHARMQAEEKMRRNLGARGRAVPAPAD
jgi:hypothetical protein